MENMLWIVVIVVLALIEFMVFGGMVGYARGKYQVPAPATTGNEIFERYFRVQQNTLEQLIVFIPSIWCFGTFVSGTWGAALGAVFLLGRAIYAAGYIKAPKQRGPGFALSSLPTIVLLLGGLIGVIRAILIVHRGM